MTHPEITDRPDDRPREAPTGRDAGGLADDSSRPAAADEAEAARIEAARRAGDPANEADDSEAHPS